MGRVVGFADRPSRLSDRGKTPTPTRVHPGREEDDGAALGAAMSGERFLDHLGDVGAVSFFSGDGELVRRR